MRRFCADFRDKPADTLTKADITLMRTAMDNPSPFVFNRCLAYLKAVLNWGVDQDLIFANPWARVKKMREPRRIPEATLEDFRRIMDHAAEHLR
ncbi:MAG: hypothetical protein JRJ59_11695, partial [Deltaproteobacteria bacterium]|nr:hypothetical protein [Deltaproteobacteria bacterium]